MSRKPAHPLSRKFSSYPRLNPLGVGRDISAADLIEQSFLAYNGGRLREASLLWSQKMLPNNGFIGMSLTGALTPAGLGKSCLIPLMRAGFVDWIVSRARPIMPGGLQGAGMANVEGKVRSRDLALGGQIDGLYRSAP